jgi:hypothetical protein
MQILGLSTSEENTVHARSKFARASQRRNSWRKSGLPTHAVYRLARCPGVGTPNLGRDFWLPQSPHRLSDWASWLLAWVVTSDGREFRLTSGHPTPKVTKTILRAREVLECLSFDIIIMLEHSIFLRPTKFASLFIVRWILNSKQNIKPLESALSSSVFTTSRIEWCHFIFVNSLNLSWD